MRDDPPEGALGSWHALRERDDREQTTQAHELLGVVSSAKPAGTSGRSAVQK
jgi:hypothetical protein